MVAVTDQAIDQIKQLIIDGEFSPGSRLPKEQVEGVGTGQVAWMLLTSFLPLTVLVLSVLVCALWLMNFLTNLGIFRPIFRFTFSGVAAGVAGPSSLGACRAHTLLTSIASPTVTASPNSSSPGSLMKIGTVTSTSPASSKKSVAVNSSPSTRLSVMPISITW